MGETSAIEFLELTIRLVNKMFDFKRIMYGRYGWDKLNWILLILFVVLAFVGRFTNNPLLATLAFIPIMCCAFRALSTNVTKRYDENYKLFHIFDGIKEKKKKNKEFKTYSKTHHHIECVNCKQKMRVPKNKGKLEVTCPKCKTVFYVKT